jgi:hypothetical protein
MIPLPSAAEQDGWAAVITLVVLREAFWYSKSAGAVAST